jgi:hypothetical protein
VSSRRAARRRSPPPRRGSTGERMGEVKWIAR